MNDRPKSRIMHDTVRGSIFVALSVLLLTVPTLGVAGTPNTESARACPGFEYVPGQGPSCPVPGGWRVLLEDGTSILTHGPDPAPSASSGWATFDDRRMPTCVADPDDATEAYALMIYAYPPPGPEPHSGVPPQISFHDLSATRVPEIRDMVNRSNAYLAAEAAKFDVDMTFKFACETPEKIRVDVVSLATPEPLSSFHTIVTELQLLGYDRSLTKYWVFYEGRVAGGVSGQASAHDDDRRTVDNRHNNGYDFAVVYKQAGDWGVHIMVHEAFHTMGAVQHSAPHSSGAFHCNDGYDTMCYADGGPSSNYTTVCDAEVLDCNNDDYFWPRAPAGTYLGNHWNVGSDLNRFVTYDERG